jgi:ABC-type multidrug transport system fused ATPase/permease subunit
VAQLLTSWRYGGRLISFGEYQTTQFFTVFIAVIFSGESAAAFFSYTTSLTKSTTAANYVFWLRRLSPAVQEDPSKPPFDDGGDKGPAHMEVQDVAFAYPSRPHAKVLENINVDVSLRVLSYSFHASNGIGSPRTIYRIRRCQWLRKVHHDIPPRALLRPRFRTHNF